MFSNVFIYFDSLIYVNYFSYSIHHYDVIEVEKTLSQEQASGSVFLL